MNKGVKALEDATNVAKVYFRISALKKLLTGAVIFYAVLKIIFLIFKR